MSQRIFDNRLRPAVELWVAVILLGIAAVLILQPG